MPQLPDVMHTQVTVTKLLNEVVEQLDRFLEKVLPSLFEDWWQQAVINTLSFQQQRRLGHKETHSLSSLDLAALLRVLDQNWYQISTNLHLPSEVRHYVKEMQTIRNRWAHAASGSFPEDDVYRDLDTLQRFASIINADSAFLDEIRITKSGLLAKHLPVSNSVSIEEPTQTMVQKESKDFALGQIVCLRSNPSVKGAIVTILPGKPENRYKVFVDGVSQLFYTSQIQPVKEKADDFHFMVCDQFHAQLTSQQIRFPGLSTLYSLNAARVDFIPYQFRPVLKFIRSDRPRLLVADGVGVGKTIEAGLILREIQARRDVRSILIICPRPLITERKWQSEMRRFEERFIHLDGKLMRYCINEMDMDGSWPDQYQRVIVPYSLFDETLLYGTDRNDKRKHKRGLLDLDPPPRFDLVIVDEAHHIRNQDTFAYKAVRFFCDHAEAAIFLTATPIQLGSHDLFTLLTTLRPDLIIDKESFEHMAEPNPFINQAVAFARAHEEEWNKKAHKALEDAASTAWGQAILQNNPEFNRVRQLLIRENISLEERVQLIKDLESLHTFSGIISRTRRRDIGDFTIRRPETVAVDFTPSQAELHDELLQVQAEIFRRLHEDINVKFMMTTIRRQAASCLFGLAPMLEEILNRHIDELAWDEADDSSAMPTLEAVSSIESQIQSVLQKARTLDSVDPKLDALKKIVRDKQSLPNNKLILFSSFRHTLSYLYDHLRNDGYRIGMVHGGTPDEERMEMRNRFELPREQENTIDILLFSEIGCEGLDYQFCDCIVNYDLPWNPMRIEQRIGRIDRNGQKSESVAIINLITPGTVDAEIYERCLVRIGVFNNALGGSEEIIGDITKQIKNIAENLSLTEEERKIKLQQLADNSIRLVQEQEELEQRQRELFGIRLPAEQLNKEIEEASSFWLSSISIKRLISLYLKEVVEKEQEFLLGEKDLKTLRLSQEARNVLLQDYQKIPRQNTIVYREWENWLKGGNQHLAVTFDSGVATKHQEVSFIMPLHPLVKQAAYALGKKGRIFTTLKVSSNVVSPGKYKFAIYQWQFYGIREDLILRPVASSEILTLHLNSLLEQAVDVGITEVPQLDEQDWAELDEHHYRLWSKSRIDHQQRTQELARYRRESLTTSHRARISLLNEQLNGATDEKIQRMRISQISAAGADYARRIQEIEIAMEKADVTIEPIAYGLLQIEGNGSNA